MSRDQRLFHRPKTLKEMAEVFKHKSGAHVKRKSRVRERQEWRKEWAKEETTNE